MTVTDKAWQSYIKKLSAINRKAAKIMQDWISVNGLDYPEELISYAYGIVGKYGEAAGALACEMYDTLARAQGKILPDAVPAEPASYSEVARAVIGTKKVRPGQVPDTVARLVKQTAADTTLQNAKRDGAQFAWIPHGDTCSFCITLASRGWQYMSKNALKNGHAEHIHANCDCEYGVRFDGKSNVAGYDPDKYLEQYNNAEGTNPQDKINSMRREQYAKDADKINARKRELYELHKDKKNQPIVTNTPKKVTNPTYGHKDVTKDWFNNATPNSHPIVYQKVFEQDGVTYKVDGNNVLFAYSDHEKSIAELLREELGGDIRIMPKVNKPDGVQTPDYIFRGNRYDLKTMRKSKSQNAIYNRIKDCQDQADNFILDITGNSLSKEELYRQAEGIFNSYHARRVQSIILIDNNEIIRIYERK